MPIKYLTVRYGSSKYASGGNVTKVVEIIKHQNFRRDTLDFDIAILKVADDMDSHEITQSIPIARFRVDCDVDVTISGWGAFKEGAAPSTILRQFDIETISRVQCQKKYKRNITENMVCAGDANNCFGLGDKGGPLTYDGELVGLASIGGDCSDPSRPSVYTNVPEFHDWITEKTK